MERRLTTILAADIAGYSRLMAADEEGVISRLKALRTEIIDPAVGAGGGRVVKTMGDGLLIEFASPVEAVRTALTVQNAVNNGEAPRAEDDKMRFRIGVHFGDVMVDGDDLLGDVVNVAARLESLAPVGGLCIAQAVKDIVVGKIEAELIDLGPQMVKNIPDPVNVWGVQIAGQSGPAKPAQSQRPSVAVLPFDNMSSNAEFAFFADGVVEDVITELSRFRSLMVISRNSSFAYRGKARDVRRIANELGVRYIVEGSVRQAGGRVRVTAQLIDAEDGGHVWADKWNRQVDDVFAVQDEITSAIVSALEPELGAHERNLVRVRPTNSLSAWDLTQQGLNHFHSWTKEGRAEAQICWDRAAELDPDYAMAQAYLARVAMHRVFANQTDDRDGDLSKGIAHANRALEIDPRNHLACEFLGMLLVLAGREAEAERAFDRGIALNPNSATVWLRRSLAGLLSDMPDPKRVIDDARTALTLSPRDPSAWSCNVQIAAGYLWQDPADKDDRALNQLIEATSYKNVEWMCLAQTALLFARRGRMAEANDMRKRLAERAPDASFEKLCSTLSGRIWAPTWAALEEAAALIDPLAYQPD